MAEAGFERRAVGGICWVAPSPSAEKKASCDAEKQAYLSLWEFII